MREAYEEISDCPEEIMYPILEGMEIGTNNGTEDTETQCANHTEEIQEESNLNVANEEDALREANNYVCSEMLECSWATSETTVSAESSSSRVRRLYFWFPFLLLLPLLFF